LNTVRQLSHLTTAGNIEKKAANPSPIIQKDGSTLIFTIYSTFFSDNFF